MLSQSVQTLNFDLSAFTVKTTVIVNYSLCLRLFRKLRRVK